jgi:hypothetical protein
MDVIATGQCQLRKYETVAHPKPGLPPLRRAQEGDESQTLRDLNRKGREPVDPMMLGMMIFTIVAMAVIGGFVVLFPITRRIGRFLESRMSEANRAKELEDREGILRALDSLRDDIARLAERQDFTERLLERPTQQKGPENAGGPTQGTD